MSSVSAAFARPRVARPIRPAFLCFAAPDWALPASCPVTIPVSPRPLLVWKHTNSRRALNSPPPLRVPCCPAIYRRRAQPTRGYPGIQRSPVRLVRRDEALLEPLMEPLGRRLAGHRQDRQQQPGRPNAFLPHAGLGGEPRRATTTDDRQSSARRRPRSGPCPWASVAPPDSPRRAAYYGPRTCSKSTRSTLAGPQHPSERKIQDPGCRRFAQTARHPQAVPPSTPQGGITGKRRLIVKCLAWTPQAAAAL